MACIVIRDSERFTKSFGRRNRLSKFFGADARRGFASLSKEIAHARSTHADEHFDKLGATDGEKWHASFTRDGSGE